MSVSVEDIGGSFLEAIEGWRGIGNVCWEIRFRKEV
jgi:hypothetical protein